MNSYSHTFDAAKVVIILHMTLLSCIFLCNFFIFEKWIFTPLMLNERKTISIVHVVKTELINLAHN
jgi:hypothetical protein